MILYFANRNMDILGNATTTLREGFVITDDLKTEDVETGVASFECRIGFTASNRAKLEEMTEAGNYILRSNWDEDEFYTIIETEIDTKNNDIYMYAEDAGLDLLNEVVGAFSAAKAQTAEWYVNKYISGTGFEIGVNEIPSSMKRKLSWDGEATVTERLASIATQFGGFEVSYTYDVDGLEITHKYINIFEERGKDIEEELRLNRDVDRILIKKSVANVATALQCTGGTPDGENNPITLEGYEYDDGEFYVLGKQVRSRTALQKWGRYILGNTSGKGQIIKRFSYDTTSQSELCNRAVAELKKIYDTEINYEIDITKMPDNIKVGDRINIVDDAGALYLSSRVLKLETSIVEKRYTATLGEYVTKDSGISKEVEALAQQFMQVAISAKNTADKVYDDLSGLEIGARNLIRNSTNLIYEDYYFS